jgi:peptide/nickel transport system ATP-binding protein
MTAVDRVSLRVESGTVVGLVGESGSGKSTLARSAVGLVPVVEGGVFVAGEEVTSVGGARRPSDRKLVQLVFQDPFSSLDPRRTVGASIAEALPKSLALTRHGKDTEVRRLLELVHLEGAHAGELPSRLSGGQRQRVAIARAIAARPQVLLADEITSALDASVQGSILNLLRELQRELGLTVLYISHNMAVTRYVSDVIAVMYMGRVVEVAPADELVTNAQHPYTRALLESIPRLEVSEATNGARCGSPRSRVVAALANDPPDPRNLPAGCAFQSRCPVGPGQLPGHTICVEIDPHVGADQRAHSSACHFTDS